MEEKKLAKEKTLRELYGPAMEITEQADADRYLGMLVQRHMTKWSKSQDEAERSVRSNLGYYAGYYSAETRARVERLFHCAHPIFGEIKKNGTPHPLQIRAIAQTIASSD